MLTKEFADHFAAKWIQAWNNHDLGLILSHYSDDFMMSSPRIAVVAGEPSGTLKGKQAIRAYWEKALALAPDLHFELISTLVGADSVTLYYKGVRGMAAEVFFFGADGKVIKACAHYG
jgi:ketosteroid isomerase-like protein